MAFLGACFDTQDHYQCPVTSKHESTFPLYFLTKWIECLPIYYSSWLLMTELIYTYYCFYLFRSIHNELEKHRWAGQILLLLMVIYDATVSFQRNAKLQCSLLHRRAQLRHCLEQLKQQVPLSSDSARNTTLNLLRRAQLHIKVMYKQCNVHAHCSRTASVQILQPV